MFAGLQGFCEKASQMIIDLHIPVVEYTSTKLIILPLVRVSE